MPAVALQSIKLIFFSHLSWNVEAGRQKPGMAVHPLAPLCPSVQVWRTIFSSVWAAALMCAMFFTCSSSFYFISWAGMLWRSAGLMWLCVFGCFGVDLRGCFYYFLSPCSKRILSAFTSLLFLMVWLPRHTWMKNSAFQPFFDTWNNRFHKLLCCSEEKGFDDVSFSWFSSAYKCSSCYVHLHKLDLFLHLSVFAFPYTSH